MTDLYIFHINCLSGTSLPWIGYYIAYFTGRSRRRGGNPLKCKIISKVR